MANSNITKIKTKNNNLVLRVEKGHFATSNAHSNYYIDVAAQKSRLSEAKAIAQELCKNHKYSNCIVDTILCLDGMEVVGTCIADELTKNDYVNINAHQTIYIVTPEMVNGSQLLFRDNIVPMIKDKHVLVIAVSVASGNTVRSAIDAVKYYGGSVAGVASIFATSSSCEGYEINSAFNPKDLPDYFSCPSYECPICKEGKKIEALVNCHGYSKL